MGTTLVQGTSSSVSLTLIVGDVSDSQHTRRPNTSSRPNSEYLNLDLKAAASCSLCTGRQPCSHRPAVSPRRTLVGTAMMTAPGADSGAEASPIRSQCGRRPELEPGRRGSGVEPVVVGSLCAGWWSACGPAVMAPGAASQRRVPRLWSCPAGTGVIRSSRTTTCSTRLAAKRMCSSNSSRRFKAQCRDTTAASLPMVRGGQPGTSGASPIGVFIAALACMALSLSIPKMCSEGSWPYRADRLRENTHAHWRNNNRIPEPRATVKICRRTSEMHLYLLKYLHI